MPIPVPGIKLGLANIVTVAALYWMGPGPALAILLVRVVLGCLATGQVAAIFYSLAGGLLSLAVMLPMRRVVGRKQVCGGHGPQCGTDSGGYGAHRNPANRRLSAHFALFRYCHRPFHRGLRPACHRKTSAILGIKAHTDLPCVLFSFQIISEMFAFRPKNVHGLGGGIGYNKDTSKPGVPIRRRADAAEEFADKATAL